MSPQLCCGCLVFRNTSTSLVGFRLELCGTQLHSQTIPVVGRIATISPRAVEVETPFSVFPTTRFQA
jgi:hypothetical protein